MLYQFSGTLHREGNRAFIPIPFNVWEETGRKGNIPCRVRIHDQSYECKLVPKGNGFYWVPVAKRLMAALGVQEEYEIVLEPMESLTRINHNSPYTRENPIRKITGIEPVSAPQGYCGHSCVAMLAGVPLEAVVSLMGREKASWSKILEALDYYGISYADKAVYPKGKVTQLPQCCIVYTDGRFLLWFDGVFYGAETVAAAKTVSYREITVSERESSSSEKPDAGI